MISIDEPVNSTFFVVSNLDEYLNNNLSLAKLNSPIVNFNIKPETVENIRITFRHLVRNLLVKHS